MIVRAAAIVWGLVVGLGLLALTAYSARPGDSGDPAPRWPSSSRIVRAVDRPTLVLFLDPLCPCSRATLAELSRAMARLRSPIAAHAVIVGRGRSTGTIPGVAVIEDERGDEKRRFGAATSGHMFLFSIDGRLAFSGGITPARGHEGDSAGGSALIAIASGFKPERPTAPVYGCPLIEGVADSPGEVDP